MPRMNAYKETFPGEQLATDSKGAWKFGAVSIESRSQYDGRNVYIFWVQLKYAEGLRSDYMNRYNVTVFESDDMQTLARRIKSATGYTPQPATMRKIWNHFEVCKAAHREQDTFYSEQSTGAAAACLQLLHDRIMERYNAGEEIRPEYSNSWTRIKKPAWQRYTTEEEQEAAYRAQSVINGHSFRNFKQDDDFGGHMSAFHKGVNSSIHAIEARIKAEQERQKQRRLDELMETDPNFRRFIAHWAAASKTKKASGHNSNQLEFVHRMEGYTTNFENWRRNLWKCQEAYWKRYDIETWDNLSLNRLAREHADNLPAVTPPHERKPGGIYYGDCYKIGGKAQEVQKVGVKYVYFRYGVRVLRDSLAD